MNFWTGKKLSTNTRNEYAALLIELVEKNEDKTWLEYFHNLKLGRDLPGGGMGSLNDWSPSYLDDREYAWFNLLYTITHRLLTEKKEPNLINEDFSIKHKNEMHILICSNCYQKFQHPRIFEHYIATFYYSRNFSKFVEQERLKDLSNPNFSYKNLEARVLRESLESYYMKNDIILFDFLKKNRVCPKCDTKMDIGHIDYEISEREGKLELRRKKAGAGSIIN